MKASAYYFALSDVIFKHHANRPVMLKTFPTGYLDPVYHRDAPPETPTWVRQVMIPRSVRSRDKGKGDHQVLVMHQPRVLTWLVHNIGEFELHPYLHHGRTSAGFRRETFGRPTAAIFDLDPGLGANILHCARVAIALRFALGTLNLKAFVKTSGGAGLHVYVPTGTGSTYDDLAHFVRPFARLVEKVSPDKVTALLPRAQRAGRVFIDWTGNTGKRTMAGAYTWRFMYGRPSVSMPLSWPELEAALDAGDPTRLHFSPERAVQRVKFEGDAWAALPTKAVTVPRLSA